MSVHPRSLPAVVCLLLLLPFAPRLAAQDPSPATVDAVFADYAKPGTPGCALAVARGGKLLYSRGYGYANLEESLPISPNSVFDIGSTSKQFSAASILLLEKQGKLSVNDDVRKYVPELPDYGKRVTILNMLNHTSGLRDYLTLFDLAGVNIDSVTTDEEALAYVSRQKALNFDPGTDWLYSNTGFFLLSVIVKRVSGQTLTEFAAQNIFQPLNMSHTLYRDSHTLLVPGRALAYDPVEKEKGGGYVLDVSYFEQTGDGAVHTTVGDLLKWDENFYTAKVGGKEFLAEIQQTGKLNSGKPLQYAKGLFVDEYRGLPRVSHGGSWGGYRAELMRFPQQHFSVVCLCNRSDSNPTKLAEKVTDLYLAPLLKERNPKTEVTDDEEPKKRDPITVSAATLEPLAGDYRNDELDVTYRLQFSGGKLILAKILLPGGIPRSNSYDGKALNPVAAGEFVMDGVPVTFRFRFDAAGKPVSFVLDAGRTTGMIFNRTSSAR